ncbi:MAG TPA: FGGY-family carbohydrate kinase [Acidimicrobiales bacterium]|nr:FGGY-family carbohydrate kinase [Acidimicrobiales bacterium]
MAGSGSEDRLVAGIDLATAAARVAVADGRGRVIARAEAPLAPPQRPDPRTSEQDARSWWPAVAGALREALAAVAADDVAAVAVSATSGTVVLVDARGEPVGPALLYDDGRAPAPQRWDRLLAGPGASSAAHAWHASDLIVARLTGTAPPTDWSHALKTGYDPGAGRWSTGGRAADLRPEVHAPASPAGRVCASAAADTSLPEGCDVRLGMTDACAAQIAAGADRPGRFVTVLGTTLAVKGASHERLDEPASGIYSHRHPDGWWLPGGASNVGGGSLVAHGDGGDLAELDRQAAARGPAEAVCYPLPRPGERFPFRCAGAEELWMGRPADPVEAHRAVLEGVAFVERLGYERLAALGAPASPPIRTAGRGGRSEVWSSIRATVLNVPVARATTADTAFGACVLAAAGTLHPSLADAGDAMVAPPGAPLEPVPEERDAMEASYRRFVAALEERGWLPWAA